MKHVKIRKIGNSLGVVLSKEVLEHLNVKEGDTLSVSETDTGLRLDSYDPEVAKQVELGRDIARRYKNTRRELAK